MLTFTPSFAPMSSTALARVFKAVALLESRPGVGAGPESTPATREASPLRAHAVQSIIVVNPAATGDYLDQFSDGEVHEYLARLESAATPRGRENRGRGWVRQSDRRAVAVATA